MKVKLIQRRKKVCALQHELNIFSYQTERQKEEIKELTNRIAQVVRVDVERNYSNDINDLRRITVTVNTKLLVFSQVARETLVKDIAKKLIHDLFKPIVNWNSVF